ncbi:MAG: ribonucleotide-diphosphate reductase subunit beta [Bacteroidetes bacterium]|nr:ribonucleotide-diphosphate reductase subunit beta [Bacteroidota bacterium]
MEETADDPFGTVPLELTGTHRDNGNLTATLSTGRETIPLQLDKKRFTIYPVRHNDLWSIYKKAESGFWTAEEIDLSADLEEWAHKLNDNERHFIKHILAFFAAGDGIVNENHAGNFLHEVKQPEARFFYGFRTAIENIHSETYSLLIDTYIRDPKEKQKLFIATETLECIKNKSGWMHSWIENGSFTERLIASAAADGIFFSGSFCSVLWLKKRGLMPGLGFANELISRDKNLQCDFTCRFYNHYIENKLPAGKTEEIIIGAADIEKNFICETLPVDIVGMDPEMMNRYIEFVADRLLAALGNPTVFNSANPFDFTEVK